MSKRLKQLKRMYEQDFFQHQASIIKKRVGFFCLLSLLIYVLAAVISFVAIPRELKLEEVGLFKILVIASVLIYFLARMARSISFAKECAYIYIVLLLYIVTRLNFIYPPLVEISAAIYIFSLFFVSFSIPWYPLETVNVAALHIAAYTILFIYSPRFIPKETASNFDILHYFGGVIFLCMGFVLSFMVRREEKTMEFENFILLKEQESRNQEIDKELNLASRVYETLVPQSANTEVVDIDVKYIPVSYMSGDYARYHFINNDLLLFIICDVTGHGVSAALLVNRMHTEFLRLLKKGEKPEGILKELNSFIINEFSDVNMYMSAFCGLADFKNGELAYSNYGHPSQYLYNSQESRIERMSSNATFLGIMENLNIEPQKTLPFSKGDRIFLFTDGLIEVKGKKQEEYGIKRLEKFILDNPSLPPKFFNQKLFEELHQFKTGDFKDDIFLINIMVKKETTKG